MYIKIIKKKEDILMDCIAVEQCPIYDEYQGYCDTTIFTYVEQDQKSGEILIKSKHIATDEILQVQEQGDECIFEDGYQGVFKLFKDYFKNDFIEYDYSIIPFCTSKGRDEG